MNFIILNRIRCLSCGDTITSCYDHHYVICSCRRCAVDGGNSYLRFLMNGPSEALTLWSDNSHDIIRHFVIRYGYGKPGLYDYGIFRKTILSSMSDSHLKALIVYCKPENKYLPIYMAEQKYRKEHNIKILDKPYIHGQI